jgi:hypothetical protein
MRKRFNGDAARAVRAQRVRDDGQRLGESGADNDALGSGIHAASTRDVAGEGGAELCSAARVGIAEGFGRRRAQSTLRRA